MIPIRFCWNHCHCLKNWLVYWESCLFFLLFGDVLWFLLFHRPQELKNSGYRSWLSVYRTYCVCCDVSGLRVCDGGWQKRRRGHCNQRIGLPNVIKYLVHTCWVRAHKSRISPNTYAHLMEQNQPNQQPWQLAQHWLCTTPRDSPRLNSANVKSHQTPTMEGFRRPSVDAVDTTTAPLLFVNLSCGDCLKS